MLGLTCCNLRQYDSAQQFFSRVPPKAVFMLATWLVSWVSHVSYTVTSCVVRHSFYCVMPSHAPLDFFLTCVRSCLFIPPSLKLRDIQTHRVRCCNCCGRKGCKKKASSCDFFLFVSASMTCISLPCTCGVCNDNKDEFYSILFFYIVLVVTPIFLVNTATASYVLTAGMNGWICVMMAWQ